MKSASCQVWRSRKLICIPELESILSSILLPIKREREREKKRGPFEVQDVLPTVLSCAQPKACVLDKPEWSNLFHKKLSRLCFQHSVWAPVCF